jgi:hypothetical protein
MAAPRNVSAAIRTARTRWKSWSSLLRLRAPVQAVALAYRSGLMDAEI